MPAAVVDSRSRVDDDRSWPVARVEYVPRPAVNQLDRQEVSVDDARPAVDEQAVRLQRTNLPRRRQLAIILSPALGAAKFHLTL